jgi:hypothetical protein
VTGLAGGDNAKNFAAFSHPNLQLFFHDFSLPQSIFPINLNLGIMVSNNTLDTLWAVALDNGITSTQLVK